MDKSFKQLSKQQQAIVLLWIKIGLSIQYFSMRHGWVDDPKPDPHDWPDLRYRLKPTDDSQ